MAMESEELKALNFVRRALLRKNDKLREYSRKISRLEGEVGRLKNFEWKCADQEKEIQSLRAELGVDHFESSEKDVESQTTYEERFDTSNERLQEGVGDPEQPGDEVKFIKSEVGIPLDGDHGVNNAAGAQGFLDNSPRARKRRRPNATDGSEEPADENDLTDASDAAAFDGVDPAGEDGSDFHLGGAVAGDVVALSNDSDALQQQQQHYLASMALAAEQTNVLDHSMDEDSAAAGGGGGSRRRGQAGGPQVAGPPLLPLLLPTPPGAGSTAFLGQPQPPPDPSVVWGDGKRSKRCPICGAVRRSTWDLSRHMRAHTGERPYKCPLCEFRGSESGNVKQHVVSRHPEHEFFHCSLCEKSFYDAVLLDAHCAKFHSGGV